MLPKTSRILIINPFGIGDVLFSTPLISNLKHNYPNLYLGYLCNKRAEDALELNPDVNQIFIWEKDYFRQLWHKSKLQALKEFIHLLMEIKKCNFNLVVDLSLNPEYSFFLSIIGIRKRIGYNFKNRGRFLTKKIKLEGYASKHIADYYLDLLKYIDENIGVTNKNFVFPIGNDDIAFANSFLKNNDIQNEDLLIGIAPGGGASWGKDAVYKQWNAGNFAKLADYLVEQFQAKIIIFGDLKDTRVCQLVLDSMKNKAFFSPSSMALRQFSAIIKKCRLVICNDGGPLHIAVSQGVKTVSIFGPVSELVYGPYPLSPDHLVISKKLPCRPCYNQFKLSACPQKYCLTEITPLEVLTSIRTILLAS